MASIFLNRFNPNKRIYVPKHIRRNLETSSMYPKIFLIKVPAKRPPEIQAAGDGLVGDIDCC